MASKNKVFMRKVRKARIRKRVAGTVERPRLVIFRSINHIYGQIVDDTTGKVLLSVSSTSKEMKDKVGKSAGNVAAAKIIGAAVGEAAIAKNIKQVVFDRNGFRYHGRVKAFADAAREKGLQF